MSVLSETEKIGNALGWNRNELHTELQVKFLVDTSPAKLAEMSKRDLVVGQLCTPLTNYANWGGPFAIDNGAFAGFDPEKWQRCLAKHEEHKERCLWVALPDVVGNARRTMELFFFVGHSAPTWPWALVAQDGLENMDVPWRSFQTLFIGGTTDWKMSQAAADLIRTAKALRINVHIGRLNTVRRYKHFAKLGADTCDGSGIARYDWMLANIEQGIVGDEEPTLFDSMEATESEAERCSA